MKNAEKRKLQVCCVLEGDDAELFERYKRKALLYSNSETARQILLTVLRQAGKKEEVAA